MALLLYKWLTVSLLAFTAPATTTPVAAPSPLAAETRHPFYVSVTEINLNKDSKELEVTCKVFAEDLEDVLERTYKTKVDLSSKAQQEQNNRLINDYFSKHLALAPDGKPARLSFVGFEKESESAFCYFEVPGVASLKTLKVSNAILQDFSTEQINIMHVIVNGTRKSYKLNYPNKDASFTF